MFGGWLCFLRIMFLRYPIKKSASIAEAASHGIRLFVCDSEEELQKIAQHAPGAKIYTRLGVDNEGCGLAPFSEIRGVCIDLCFSVMQRPRSGTYFPRRVHFMLEVNRAPPLPIMTRSISRAHFSRRRGVRHQTDHADIGGGFPVQYRAPVPEIERFASDIDAALTAAFRAERPFIMSEPGRYLVAGSRDRVQ